jgi:hypothetical protein
MDRLSKIIYDLESKVDWIKTELESIIDDIDNALMHEDDTEKLIDALEDIKSQLKDLVVLEF